MKKLYALLLFILIVGSSCYAQKREKIAITERDLYPDTWVATDAIGRTMPTSEQTGDV